MVDAADSKSAVRKCMRVQVPPSAIFICPPENEITVIHRTHILDNEIQNYAWGSKTAIQDLLGIVSDQPMAELWMGAHPKAPSAVFIDGERVTLDKWIKSDPEPILGTDVNNQFHGQLPFLFKILAAEKPLSIQVHPNKQQAEDGFARENALNIPLDSPNRNYRDTNHKPEIICAITDFWAMNGFRSVDEIISLINTIVPGMLRNELDTLKTNPDSTGFRNFFQTLMTLIPTRRSAIIEEAVIRASSLRESNPVYDWILKLHDEYPDDIGILSPAYLNLVKLKPGEGMFLDSCVLHAYLHGLGVELMANSDNVLRGGLTPKHIDLDELFRVVKFDPHDPDIQEPLDVMPDMDVYTTDTDEFELSIIKLKDDKEGMLYLSDGIEIFICIDGDAIITDTNSDTTHISKGVSVVIPAAVDDYHIKGTATIFKASVPPVQE